MLSILVLLSLAVAIYGIFSWRALFKEYGLLNLGAGVGFEFYQIEPDETFGFNGSGLQPFGQGVFQPYSIEQG